VRRVNLEKAIEEPCRLVISVLDTVYDKALGTLFKGENKKLEEYREKLADLRMERDGGLVFRISQDTKVMIHTMREANMPSRPARTRRKRGGR